MTGRNHTMAVCRAAPVIEAAASAAFRFVVVGSLVLSGACASRRSVGLAANDGGTTAAVATNSATDGSLPSPSIRSASAPPGSSANVGALSAGPREADGGAHSCRIARGPVELPMRGAVSLALRGSVVDAILNDGGRARVAAFPWGPIPQSGASVSREPATEEIRRALAVPCASTQDWDFCPDRDGAVHRTAQSGGEDRVVASSRTGTRIAASTLAGSHTALAYLASRQTSEGWVSEAWLAIDDDRPLRLSEDGSGATSVAFAMAGSSLVSLTVDARTALTAMHARPVTYDHAAHLGEDVVVFVGGPGDRRTAAALARLPNGELLGLLPISKDVGDFGLALVKLEDPPRVDEPVAWAMYPNGLDPAPVAVASGRTKTWVVRVRPQDAQPGSQRELELGELVDAASLRPWTVVQTAGTPLDVAIAVDGAGALWVAWLDSSGSWLERLVCR